MQSKDELILLEDDGVKGKYLCIEDNTIVEAIGTVAVPREKKVAKYRGTIIWSKKNSVTLQVKAIKKICGAYCSISSKEIMQIARKEKDWIFGEFYGVEAANIIELSKKYHLNIEMIDINTGEKLHV